MSFSVSYIGTVRGLKAQLAKHSNELYDQSKAEFDAVLPAMNAILEQNVSSSPVVLQLEASGHASFDKGEKVYGSCSVNVRPLGYMCPEPVEEPAEPAAQAQAQE